MEWVFLAKDLPDNDVLAFHGNKIKALHNDNFYTIYQQLTFTNIHFPYIVPFACTLCSYTQMNRNH